MCSEYEGPKPEHKKEIDRKLREEIFGFVPHERTRPTNAAPIILPIEDRLEYREYRWGFVVAFDPAPMFNARSETKPKNAPSNLTWAIAASSRRVASKRAAQLSSGPVMTSSFSPAFGVTTAQMDCVIPC